MQHRQASHEDLTPENSRVAADLAELRQIKKRLQDTLAGKPQPVPPPPPRKPPEPPQRAHDGVATDSKGNIRTDVWKGIHDEGDVRALVDQVNADNGGFSKARAGEMPAEHVLTISEATGIPAHELVTDGIGIKFNNDTKVRAGMQALHDTAHQWHSAAQRAVSANDVDSLIKYQEQELLHGVIQEYVTGKLAEAGRSLAVTQEFYEGRGTQRPLRDKPKGPVSTGKEGETAPKPTFDKGDGLKEFREKVKDKDSLDAFNKARGDSTEEVRARAKRVSELNPATNSVVREGARQLKAKKIEESPWYEKLYRESLVSGPFSHFRYAVAGVIRNGLGSTVVPFFNASPTYCGSCLREAIRTRGARAIWRDRDWPYDWPHRSIPSDVGIDPDGDTPSPTGRSKV